MNFSRRLPHELRPNALTELLREKRQAGARILDLTESNPTNAGIEYPAGFLSSLAADAAARYEPEPFGLPAARATVARVYGAPADRIVLTASTSEAYSWLFKLFCDAGDEVLVPRPSYPLFDYLAALESVNVRPYDLFYDHGWFIDFQHLYDAWKPLHDQLDHNYLNEVAGLENPTSEVLARWIWERMKTRLEPLVRVTVFETCDARCEYEG